MRSRPRRAPSGQRHDEPVELAPHDPASNLDRPLAGWVTVEPPSSAAASRCRTTAATTAPRSGRPIASCVEPPPTSQTATAPSKGSGRGDRALVAEKRLLFATEHAHRSSRDAFQRPDERTGVRRLAARRGDERLHPQAARAPRRRRELRHSLRGRLEPLGRDLPRPGDVDAETGPHAMLVDDLQAVGSRRPPRAGGSCSSPRR